MIKDVSSIVIQGANFVESTQLALFEPRDGKDKSGNEIIRNVKGSLLYGRNGSGKSTIAKAFRKVKGEDIPSIRLSSILNKDGVPVVLSDDIKRQIFVFDEDYVNAQVKLKADHLDTIIMLGQAADLADQIEEAEIERDAAGTALERAEAIYKEYLDISNPKSPNGCLVKIRNALRGDDSWAGRDSRIRHGRQNTQVRDDTYKQFLGLNPEKPKAKLLIEFEDQMTALQDAESGSTRIDISVPALPVVYDGFDDEVIRALLETEIERPQLSDRERYLLELVESGKATELSQKVEFFKNPSVEVCPYCFQPISSNYRESLVESIEKVLSKEVEKHQKELKNTIYEDLELDFSSYVELESYKPCVDLVDRINTAILQYDSLAEQKFENPYEPIKCSNLGVSGLIQELKQALTRLELDRIEFNAKATKTDPIINKLKEINSQIAYYDIKNLVDDYNKQLEELKIAEKELTDARKEFVAKNLQVEQLEANRKNVHIALDIINACFKYIFFAEDRLKIEYTNGEYRLYSNGKSVRPCDVSVGERNIIGLSYFFTSIMEYQEEKDVYGKEYLLIIDDPVSSYDIENKVGILSFLKYKLSEFLEGNENTKALVMTHDLTTFYDLHKMFEEIVSSCKRGGYSVKPKFNVFEINDCILTQFKYKNRQEYTEILKAIFNYGQGKTEDKDIVIGNIMRQALEAFSTFQYKKGIEEVSTDPDILALLPEPEYRSYYKNLMYRLVLHGGSHKAEQIKAMKDYEFFSLISTSEKRRTAKEVLCFLYLLNKQHVLEHLKEINGVGKTLNVWCDEVKARAAMP